MNNLRLLEVSLATKKRLGFYKAITDVVDVTVHEWYKKEGDVLAGIKNPDTGTIFGEAVVRVESVKGKKVIEADKEEIGMRIQKILIPEGKTVTIDLRCESLCLAELAGKDEIFTSAESPKNNSVTDSDYKPPYRLETIRISPSARRLAEELSVSLKEVCESLAGNILEIKVEDVRVYYEAHKRTSMPDVRHAEVFASPYIRARAKDLGISPADIKGSGPGSIILARDLTLRAVEKGMAASDVNIPNEEDDVEFISPDAPRRTIARNLQRAVNGNFSAGRGINIPSAGDGIYVDASKLMLLRGTLKNCSDVKEKISLGFEGFFLTAASHLLAEEKFRHLNACWEWLPDKSARIVRYRHINLAIPVAALDGLKMPILKHCECKSFSEIANEADFLIKKALSGDLSEEEQEGYTFTVNNSGVLGGEDPDQIVPVGTSVIIAFGHIGKDHQMRLNVKFDHRLHDGHHVMPFLLKMKEMLEIPEAILLQ